MHPRSALLLAAFTLVFASSCGLKGPLYLPDQKNTSEAVPEDGDQRKRPARPLPAPQSQKEDAAEAEQSPPSSPPDPDQPAESSSSVPPAR